MLDKLATWALLTIAWEVALLAASAALGHPLVVFA